MFSDRASDGFAASSTGAIKIPSFGHDVAFFQAPGNTSKNAFYLVALFKGVRPFTEREMCENDVEIATRPNTGTT